MRAILRIGFELARLLVILIVLVMGLSLAVETFADVVTTLWDYRASVTFEKAKGAE